ncbi:MAG: Glycos-transf-1 domain-containing protein [Thermoanaerobacterium thermosaccharolyticum]
MNIGIDLLYVKHGKVGGIESYIRNLMNGLIKYSPNNFNYYLFTSKDNTEYFNDYYKNNHFYNIVCNVESKNVSKRLIWESCFLDFKAKKNNIDLMFIPVYNKPFFTVNNIPYITVIHDLQLLHYPNYFSIKKRLWMKMSWKNALITSKYVIAISNFVKQDIINNFNINNNKIKVIYNPIIKSNKKINFDIVSKKYNIEKEKYFYTVSSMEPHKNLQILLQIIKILKNNIENIPKKLVISGVGGTNEKKLLDKIKELDLQEDIILTGFISNEERDCLYKNAKIFLFPSTFEGFGMPPIESLMYGTPVVTTRCASIPEVTQGKAIYVDDYNNPQEWIDKIKLGMNQNKVVVNFDKYNLKSVTLNYIKLFKQLSDK